MGRFGIDNPEKYRWFFRYFLRSHWYTERCLPTVDVPILFISGLEDELIPPAQMRALYDLCEANPRRQLYTVPNGDHNSTDEKGGAVYYETMRNFIGSCL